MLEKVRLAIDSSSMAFIHGNKENCRESIYEHLESLCKQFETDEFNFISEDRSSNFRNEVAVTNEYKAVDANDQLVGEFEGEYGE